ncbi:amino acid ABC transporter membrane protein 2 (PAAT family) [Orbus hercynius]|uniref:Amino acid ABC transporter membrane protein 2 (PAAT family) n=1 Tax=Orbus hercynius TaxID=593135 RepID=A0A495RIA0_9GAMM|nr:amino acid ABC transporter permease [Orbus hercynius]RKS87263.1 amino acid ABC transporter membrane protein 2 (PAAT family) [Orbus hercynius]
MDFSQLIKGFDVVWQNLDYLAWGNYPDGPISGIALTLLMSLAAIVLATGLGIIAGIGLVVLTSWPRRILVTILAFLQAIPIIMLIFWSYFLVPVLFQIDVPAIFTVIMALALIGAAYIAYAVFAGMIAITDEQWQAAYSLGLKRQQVIVYIILPQAIRMMMPSFINQWISLIKDSSLAYIVGVAEFTFLATQVNNRVIVNPTQIFLFVIAVYFVICWSLNFAASRFIKQYQLS